jgi:hypothetical protein
MTVALNDLLVGPVTPTNGTTLISIDFYFENASDLEVYKSGSNTPLTITTDYTVSLPSGVNETDGSITLVTPADGTDRYSIYLKQPLRRSSDLQFRSDQRSPVLNLEFDRIWRAIQGIETALDRVFKFSQTSDVPLPLDAETAAARSNQLIGFTADGTQLALIITPEGLATLAGLTDEIAAIGSLGTEIGALYVIRTDITALAGVSGGISTVAGFAAQLTDFFGAGATEIGGRIDIDTTEDTALNIRATNPGIGFVDSTNGANARINAGDTGNLSYNADINDEQAGSYHRWAIDGSTFMRLAAGGKLRVGADGDAAVTAEFQGTDAIRLPVGTTAQRPTEAAGHIRLNSTTGNLEFYDGSGWQVVATV